MNRFEPTEEAIARYGVKAALGQAQVVVDPATNEIRLLYHRFDSDTGQRVEDEVTLIVYADIAALAAEVKAQYDALGARYGLLVAVLEFLDWQIAQYHEPPSVTITAPDAGAHVSGEFVVRASVTDNHGVAAVTLSVSGIGDLGAMSEASAGVYEYALDASGVPAGTYTLTVTARDVDGNTTQAAVNVVV